MHAPIRVHVCAHIYISFLGQKVNIFLTSGLEKCMWQWSPLQIKYWHSSTVTEIWMKTILQSWLSCYECYNNTYQRWACSQIPVSLTHSARVLASVDPTGTDSSLLVYGYYLPLPLSILDSCHKPKMEENQTFGLHFSWTQADFSHWDY
jgi:hypothetical protein